MSEAAIKARWKEAIGSGGGWSRGWVDAERAGTICYNGKTAFCGRLTQRCCPTLESLSKSAPLSNPVSNTVSNHKGWTLSHTPAT